MVCLTVSVTWKVCNGLVYVTCLCILFRRDTYIVGISDCLTSIFAGLVIFSIIGYMAAQQSVDIDKVVDEGPGLAFIVYPAVVTHLPAAPLWAVLFFLMLITLGLGTQV